ncbi:hypothetical protein LZ31DRAFT_548700 [Colletotrichum somersetense]|nr:hypothetical protein LZ31DRAFT_548700 [Colletotrichum somersetense]
MSLSFLLYSSAFHPRPASGPISSQLARQQKSVQVPERAPCDAQEPLGPATTMPLAASGSDNCLPMHAICLPTQPRPEYKTGDPSALRRYTNVLAPPLIMRAPPACA